MLPVNATLNGRILPGDDADVDCFAIDLKKGQRLGVEIEAVRLATQHFGGENDCQIRVFVPNGSVRARCDDTALWLQDPFVSLEAPVAGRYVVEVSQQMHAPRVHCLYRLHVGGFKRPVAVYPAGGTPGSRMEATVFESPNGKQAFRCAILLPGEARDAEVRFFECCPEGAQIVRQQIGSGVLRVDPEKRGGTEN